MEFLKKLINNFWDELPETILNQINKYKDVTNDNESLKIFHLMGVNDNDEIRIYPNGKFTMKIKFSPPASRSEKGTRLITEIPYLFTF